jgi:hypothetical protein
VGAVQHVDELGMVAAGHAHTRRGLEMVFKLIASA